MSVPVDVHDLAARFEEYGRTPYLVTTSDELRPHTTHVVTALRDGRIVCNVGRRTAANARSRPLVTFLWPPAQPGGYSLIVDGEATVADDEDLTLEITPTKAILHRNARGEGYAADCLRLDGTQP